MFFITYRLTKLDGRCELFYFLYFSFIFPTMTSVNQLTSLRNISTSFDTHYPILCVASWCICNENINLQFTEYFFNISSLFCSQYLIYIAPMQYMYWFFWHYLNIHLEILILRRYGISYRNYTDNTKLRHSQHQGWTLIVPRTISVTAGNQMFSNVGPTLWMTL